jgi:RNA polymerase sigma-70 factor, ECF subfamily
MHTMTWNIADLALCADAVRPSASAVDAVARERDWTDIRGSLEGDHDAYARLVARYQPPIFQQMWHFTRDVHDQDELVQEVFIDVYRSLGKYRGDAPFLHWVRRIATRVGYRYWKQQARRQRLREALARDPVEPLLEPGDATASEAAAHLHSLLAQLPASERLILTLTYFENCSSAEIAARMGWSATLVRVQAYRARRKLKDLLEEAGFGRNHHE